MKITVVGAGNVGATLAMRIVEGGIGDVALVDVVDGLAQGKALDIADSSPIIPHEYKIAGSTDYSIMSGSDVVVVTAGLARKPGMSRDDLITKNAMIVKDVTGSIKKFCHNPIVIIVTNPLDVMAYYAYRISGLDKKRVLGMSGTLDTSRFVNLIADEMNVKRSQVKTTVLGCHGDTMVPLVSQTFISGKPITSLMSADKLKAIVDRTKNRGAEIVTYLKTGSAYYSPSAGVLMMLRAIKEKEPETVPASVLLEGEYGISGCFLGVPIKLNSSGIQEVIELDISPEELSALRDSSEKTKELILALPKD